MAEFTEVTIRNITAFQNVIPKDMIIRAVADDLYVLGAVDDENYAVGAIICEPEDLRLKLLHIYVDPKYRRQGIAADLLVTMCDEFVLQDNYVGLDAEFTVGKDFDNGLKEFFEYFEADLKESDNECTYECRVENLVVKELTDLKSGFEVKSFKELNTYQKNLLMKEPSSLIKDGFEKEVFDMDLSCTIIDEDDVKGCFAVAMRDDALFFEWIRADADTLTALIALLAYMTKEALKKYGKDKKIVIPVISASANKLVNKLIRDGLELTEKNVTVSIDFDYELEEAE